MNDNELADSLDHWADYDFLKDRTTLNRAAAARIRELSADNERLRAAGNELVRCAEHCAALTRPTTGAGWAYGYDKRAAIAKWCDAADNP